MWQKKLVVRVLPLLLTLQGCDPDIKFMLELRHMRYKFQILNNSLSDRVVGSRKFHSLTTRNFFVKSGSLGDQVFVFDSWKMFDLTFERI